MKHICAIFAFALFLSTNGMTQGDYALFIHGFQGSDESWLGSGTPVDWRNDGIIDDYVVINYDLEDLENSTTQAALITSIASAMAAKSSTGNWVIVGHSLGGIITRVGYPALQAALPQANIKAILNVGAPHQGARAAHVSLGPVSGYINVEPVLTEFRNLVEDPLTDVHWTISWLTSLISPDALSQIDQIPDLLDDAKEELEVFADASVDNTVKNIIGLNGNMIQLINSSQHAEPDHVRSVIGAEKKFIVPRAASELLGPGNEKNTLQNFNDIRGFYQANASAWDVAQVTETYLGINCILSPACSAITHFNNAKDARRKRDRWNRGRNALDNIDGTWGKMIDSYSVMTVPMGMWVMVECEEEPEPDPTMPGQEGPGGTYEIECWEYQYVNTNIYFPAKNDVIVGPDYAVWNPNEDPDVQNGINYYYDDIPADGGYNHFELRRYKRAYSLSGVFNQGDLAPPMDQAADWLDEEVFQ